MRQGAPELGAEGQKNPFRIINMTQCGAHPVALALKRFDNLWGHFGLSRLPAWILKAHPGPFRASKRATDRGRWVSEVPKVVLGCSSSGLPPPPAYGCSSAVCAADAGFWCFCAQMSNSYISRMLNQTGHCFCFLRFAVVVAVAGC